MTVAAPAAPTRRIAPAVARAAVLGIAAAVAWWLGTAVAGAAESSAPATDPAGPAGATGAADPGTPPPDLLGALAGLLPSNSIVLEPLTPVPELDTVLQPAAAPQPALGPGAAPAPQAAAAPPRAGLVDTAVAPLLTPAAPAGTRAPALEASPSSAATTSAAAPVYAAVAPVVDPLTRSLLGPVVDPVAQLVAPGSPGTLGAPGAPPVAGLVAPLPAEGADRGLTPPAEELAPGPLLAAPALASVASDPSPAPAPTHRHLTVDDAPAGRALRTAHDLGVAGHAAVPAAAGGASAPAAPTGSSGADDHPEPRATARGIPWAPGPAGAGGPSTGSRDLPDRTHGAVTGVAAATRVAMPAGRAPVLPAGVGGSVSATSRPAVTPD